jgi:hypothetical protein
MGQGDAKMKHSMIVVLILVAAMFIAGAARAVADTVTVGALGQQGWFSDDTRNSSGQDLVGTNYTHAGKPGQTPTAADDVQIANQIQFVENAPGGGPALKLSFGQGTGAGKATVSNIDTGSGFATGDWSTNFFANLRRYRDTETNTTLKIGVQSTDWALSQSGFTAIRSGESAWDLTLVYAGNYTPFHQWEDVSLTATSGTWCLFDQSGNAYYTTPGNSANKTLADWAADPTYGAKLFGAGAKVTSVLIGAGSFSVASTGYVAYLETSLLNGGDRIEFVPEPSTLVLLVMAGLGALACVWRRRRS